MLKLHTPKNMNGYIQGMLEEAGKPFLYVSEDELPRIDSDNFESDFNVVLRLRSADIAKKVRQYGHIGIVGSDWMRESKLKYPGIKIEILDSYEIFGRKNQKSKLELIVRNDVDVNETAQLKPSIVSGEYENLMINHFETNGWDGRIVVEGKNGAPSDPKEFIQFCENKDFIGIDINHGSIGELVRIGGHYGFMVSETDDTKKNFGVKSISVIEEVKGYLIADPDALNDVRLRSEILEYKKNLRHAYEITIEGLQPANHESQYRSHRKES